MLILSELPFLSSLADIAPFYTEPTFVGGAAAVVLLVAGYVLTRKKPSTPEKPEEKAPENLSPKERKYSEPAKSTVGKPQEKPSSAPSKFGGAAQQAEAEARNAEEEALRLAAERKRRRRARPRRRPKR
jgi:hypothetical protein